MPWGWHRRWLVQLLVGGNLSLLIATVLFSDNLALHSRTLSLTPICQIQGSGLTSPYRGKTVRTRGVVYADFDSLSRKGFYMQTQNCDGKSATSDGIFVYLGEQIERVSSADLVEVTGTVDEYYGMTEILANPADISLISSGNPLPAPIELSPPFNPSEAKNYYETIEAMHVSLADSLVVGPTSEADETWVVDAHLGLERVFHDDPQGTGEIVCVDDSGLYEIIPEAKVGDRVLGLDGALRFSLGIFRVELIASPTLVAALPPEEGRDQMSSSGVQGASLDFTVATFNLANLFDTSDDPETEDTILSAAEYQRRLKKRAIAIHSALEEPTLIAVQEAENLAVLQALVNRPEIEADYGIIWQDGPDVRGIDVALLYQVDRVAQLSYQQRQACTNLVDGLGPDGNLDMELPANEKTCDTDGNGSLDGNRLFSRPPLVIRLSVCPGHCEDLPTEDVQPVPLTLIVNHWKSKLQDTTSVQHTLPRRIEQAHFVVGLVREIQDDSPGANILIVGDLNDYPQAEPILILKQAGFGELLAGVPKTGRYTFIHQGVSQVLDYIFTTVSPRLVPSRLWLNHINADYPAVFAGYDGNYYRSSDHDLFTVQFSQVDNLVYLPVIYR